MYGCRVVIRNRAWNRNSHILGYAAVRCVLSVPAPHTGDTITHLEPVHTLADGDDDAGIRVAERPGSSIRRLLPTSTNPTELGPRADHACRDLNQYRAGFRRRHRLFDHTDASCPIRRQHASDITHRLTIFFMRLAISICRSRSPPTS